ncbi:MAG: hypothetical protein MHPSP_001089 [Paramarteilia canceri]
MQQEQRQNRTTVDEIEQKETVEIKQEPGIEIKTEPVRPCSSKGAGYSSKPSICSKMSNQNRSANSLPIELWYKTISRNFESLSKSYESLKNQEFEKSFEYSQEALQILATSAKDLKNISSKQQKDVESIRLKSSIDRSGK